ncbi:MAG: hypothetical protein CMP68_01025 [Flavobacteriales bacterium]|mgnify:FL=1|nr:hypothetical protein [Flavobacteriales bacterium]|tara:strand:+ start:18192 stop:18698 length:507 start_codon:yes stop_codon:yes gene_type:complete
MKNRTLLIITIILIGAFSRIIPHPPNFTAIGAISILGGVYFGKNYLAFLVPILSMLISDFLLGFNLALSVYLSFLIMIPLGIGIKNKLSNLSVIKTSIYASILFFLVTNLSVWFFSTIYPNNIYGLLICYYAGIPFFFNTLLGNIFFSFSLFGIYELISKRKFIYINS